MFAQKLTDLDLRLRFIEQIKQNTSIEICNLLSRNLSKITGEMFSAGDCTGTHQPAV